MPSDPMMGLKKPYPIDIDPDPKVMAGLRGPFSWAKDRKKPADSSGSVGIATPPGGDNSNFPDKGD